MNNNIREDHEPFMASSVSPGSEGKKRKRGISQSDGESRKREKSEDSSQEPDSMDSEVVVDDKEQPTWLPEATQLLRKALQNEDAKFTKKQLDVLKSLLNERKNTLFIVRTGGGKSATYFVTTPLLRRQNPNAGPTIVVSPLIALMTDQVRHAKNFGLNAMAYNSSTSPIAKNRVLKALKRNEVDILFLSAEMLCSESFLCEVPQLHNSYTPDEDDTWTIIPMIVIDEVHCISEWGHDFRLQYFTGLQTIMKQQWALDALILGTSATVPTHTQQDIVKVFNDCQWNVIRGDLFRENLAVRVIYGGKTIAEKISWMKKLLAKDPNKNVLIFSKSKKDVEEIATSIPGIGYYHADIDPKKRTEIEEDFSSGKLKILASTIALAMGFDKHNIDYVIHTYTPASAIQYYQEIGRAGRGIESATAFLLHSQPWLSNIKSREVALRRIFTTMAPEAGKPCKISEIIQVAAAANVPEKDVQEAIQLGLAKAYFVANGQEHITLPKIITDEQLKEHMNFTLTRQKELQFMHGLMSITETKCIWVKLLQFLGQETDENFKCNLCSRCDTKRAEVRMVAIPERWKITTKQGITVYGLSHNNSEYPVDADDVRELLISQEADLSADPPAWAMTYIPDKRNQNKEACKLIAEDLGLTVYEFVQQNLKAGSMTASHTDEVREQVIRNKFFLDENKLPFYKVLVYDDAAKSGMTMDKIVSFLKRNNQDRHAIGLVSSIWTCQGYPAPIKLNLN